MAIEFDAVSVIILLGVAQGVILSSVLSYNYTITHRQDTLLLALLLAVSSYTIFYGILIPTNLYYYTPHLLQSGVPLQFLIGPLYYFYTRTLTGHTVRCSWKLLLHAFPALIVFAVLVPFYSLPGEAKITYISTVQSGAASFRGMALWIFFLVHFLFYLGFSFLMVIRYEKSIRQALSNIQRITLAWFNYLTLSIVITFLVLIGMTFLYNAGLFPLDLSRLIALSVSVFLYIISYRMILKPHVYSDQLPDKEKRKYTTSHIDTKKAEDLKRRLQQMMEEEELYLEPDLTIHDLARRLDEKSGKLSQLFSQYMHTSFYELVNTYRTEHVMTRMKDSAFGGYTILDLAYEAGFNSKASFNSFFKKYTGTTPSSFRGAVRS